MPSISLHVRMMINGNITKWQVVEVESEIEIVGNNSWYLDVVDRHTYGCQFETQDFRCL